MIRRIWVISAIVFAVGYALGLDRQISAPRALGSEPVRSTVGATLGGDPAAASASILAGLMMQGEDFREMARLGALMETLSSEEIAALATRLTTLSERQWGKALPGLIAAWCRRDGAAASAWMRQYLESNRHYSDTPVDIDLASLSALVVEWAKNAPNEAVEYALAHSDQYPGLQILYAALLFPPAAEPSVAFSWIKRVPSESSQKELIWMYAKAADDSDAMFAAAGVLPPGKIRDFAMSACLEKWAETEPISALERLGQISDPFSAVAVVKVAGEKDLKGVIAWLDHQPDLADGLAGRWLVMKWAETDPHNAFRWALAHDVSLTEPVAGGPDDSVRDRGWDPPLMAGARQAPEATLAWIRAQPPGPERDRLFEMAAEVVDAHLLPSMMSELPGEAAVRAASRAGRILPLETLRPWAEQLPPKLRAVAFTSRGKYLGLEAEVPSDLPPGPDRDAVIAGLIMRPIISLEKRLNLARKISDPVLKQQMIDDANWEANRSK